MKVLLVDPPGRAGGLNMGLAYLSAFLKENGHDVRVMDMNNLNYSIPDLLMEVEEVKPKIIGFSVHSYTYKETQKLVSEVKKRYPQTSVVVGGPQVTLVEEEIMEENPGLDFAITGEGEITLLELVDKIAHGKGDLESINGLIYRDPIGITKNEPRDFIDDLDLLPFPDYGSFGIAHIYDYPLLTSRGCPYDCSFCCAPVLCKRRWRARSPENIIKEMQYATITYQSKHILIMDDNFTLDKERAELFCDLLVDSASNFQWTCDNGLRADRVDEHLIRKMKRAGCISVSIGIESLVPEVFNATGKGESLTDIRQAIDVLHQEGIPVGGFFITGLPYDTFQRTMQTYRESLNLALKKTTWQILVPNPNTKVWGWIQQNGTILMPYEEASSLLDVVFETPDYTKGERAKAIRLLALKSKLYGSFFDINRSLVKNVFDLLRAIVRYDILRLPVHLYYLIPKFFQFIFFRKTRAEIVWHFEYDRSKIRKGVSKR